MVQCFAPNVNFRLLSSHLRVLQRPYATKVRRANCFCASNPKHQLLTSCRPHPRPNQIPSPARPLEFCTTSSRRLVETNGPVLSAAEGLGIPFITQGDSQYTGVELQLVPGAAFSVQRMFPRSSFTTHTRALAYALVAFRDATVATGCNRVSATFA